MNNANELIDYYKSLGLEVHTSTKARGHQGFFSRKRIDISKNISAERFVPTLVHEFAHYVHSLLEGGIERNGGSLEKIFNDKFATELFEDELFKITTFVDANSKCERLFRHKNELRKKISDYSDLIKFKYPDFQRSKPFKPFEKYIKSSRARFLLKYDRVKLISGFLFKKTEILSIDNLERDFEDMPPEFCAYIRLNSCRKKQSRISAKINRLNKYYSKPTELFARFVEGLYIDAKTVRLLAPKTFERFLFLLKSGYYPYLDRVIDFL